MDGERWEANHLDTELLWPIDTGSWLALGRLVERLTIRQRRPAARIDFRLQPKRPLDERASVASAFGSSTSREPDAKSSLCNGRLTQRLSA